MKVTSVTFKREDYTMQLMKHIYLPILLIFSLSSFAQKNIGTHTYSGFGGPVVKFTEIYKHTTPMIGGKGAFLYDNKYYIGGAGYSIIHNNDYLNNNIPNQKYNFSYAGLLLGRLYTPEKNFHINTQLLPGSAITFLYMPNSTFLHFVFYYIFSEAV